MKKSKVGAAIAHARSVPRLASALRHPAFALTLAVATSAQAASLSSETDPSGIYGGAPSAACAWPTAVFMEGCTGTLVHPEIVVYAAHCLFFAGGVAPTVAVFGEQAGSPQREVDVVGCQMSEGWTPGNPEFFGDDVAICQLAEPVLDVEIVPILMGCENELLVEGQEITLVGFGITDTGQNGIKHEVVTTVNHIENDEVNLGGGGTSSCNGDSGGPAFIQLDDGSWRVFGVTSRGESGSCADPSFYGQISLHVPWIEELSGIDITPCHDADGTWNPGDGCTEFPMSPGVAASDWAAGCGGGELSLPSQTCGEPFGGGGSTGDSTGGDETGLDESGGSSTGELPGGTVAGSDSSGSDSTGASGGEDTDGGGCSCRSDSAGSTAGAWLLLGGLLFARRRRE